MKKVVLKVELNDEKAKQKAMKIVSGLSGVDSIVMEMKDKKLTVIGEIDPVIVVGKLRKLCPTEIVSVGPAKEPEKKKDDQPKKEEAKKGGGDEKKKDQKAEVPPLVKAYQDQFYIQQQHHLPLPYNYQHPPYYQQHPYYNQQHPPPPMSAQHYYGRTVEEEPNACVIC